MQRRTGCGGSLVTGVGESQMSADGAHDHLRPAYRHTGCTCRQRKAFQLEPEESEVSFSAWFACFAVMFRAPGPFLASGLRCFFSSAVAHPQFFVSGRRSDFPHPRVASGSLPDGETINTVI